MICLGSSGVFFELDPVGNEVWRYINPVSQAGPLTQGDTPALNSVFRCSFLPPSYAGLAGQVLTPGDEIELDPIVPSLCVTTSIGHPEPVEGPFDSAQGDKPEVFPNPASDHFTITGTSITAVELFDVNGRCTSLPISMQGDRCIVDVSKMAAGIYNVPVRSKDGTRAMMRLLLAR